MIDPAEVILSKIIGEGSFGRVWSGKWRNNSVAVKEFVFAQAALIGGSQHVSSIVEEIIGEAGVMTCLRHPKILQLYGCSLTVQAVWIICELCDKGSLRMLLNDPNVSLNPAAKASLCLDIADGMMYLHRRKPSIIHRDLKTHNVFVLERFPGKYIAKIGDWGSARAVALSKEKTLTQGVGTACWLAPEVIMHAHYSKESDVYAFGIVLWEIFTRQEVYPRLSAAQIIAKVANEGLRPQVPAGCPWEDVMRRCWRRQPEERPTFGDIIAVLSEIYSREKVGSQSTPDKEAMAAGDMMRSPHVTPGGKGGRSGVGSFSKRPTGHHTTKYYSG
jgi:serine/threonine protein kinase